MVTDAEVALESDVDPRLDGGCSLTGELYPNFGQRSSRRAPRPLRHLPIAHVGVLAIANPRKRIAPVAAAHAAGHTEPLGREIARAAVTRSEVNPSRPARVASQTSVRRSPPSATRPDRTVMTLRDAGRPSRRRSAGRPATPAVLQRRAVWLEVSTARANRRCTRSCRQVSARRRLPPSYSTPFSQREKARPRAGLSPVYDFVRLCRSWAIRRGFAREGASRRAESRG
jgi:hypothetical protein